MILKLNADFRLHKRQRSLTWSLFHLLTKSQCEGGQESCYKLNQQKLLFLPIVNGIFNFILDVFGLFIHSCSVVSWVFTTPWNFPGKNIAVDCHFLLQGIFSTQGMNLQVNSCVYFIGRQILYHWATILYLMCLVAISVYIHTHVYIKYMW